MGNPSRHEIICDLLGFIFSEAEFKSKYNKCDSFFNDWYDEQCESVGVLPVSLVGNFSLLRSTISEPRQTVLDEHLAKGSSIIYHGDHDTQARQDNRRLNSNAIKETANVQLALLARVWLMVSLDSPKYSLFLGQGTSWLNESSLIDTINNVFKPGMELSEKTNFPMGFTAANLEMIAGIQVVWTSNLADHLSLTCDDTKVILFHQVSFLELHKRSNV